MKKTIHRHYPSFHELPKRRLKEDEKKDILINIERIRIKRDKYATLLNRALVLYLLLLMIAILSVINNSFPIVYTNIIIIIAMAVLILASVPFMMLIYRDDKEIDEIIKKLASDAAYAAK